MARFWTFLVDRSYGRPNVPSYLVRFVRAGLPGGGWAACCSSSAPRIEVHIAWRQIARCSGHMDEFHSSISLSSLHPVNLQNLLRSDGSLYEAQVRTICFSSAYLCEICCSVYQVRLSPLMQKSACCLVFFFQELMDNVLKGHPWWKPLKLWKCFQMACLLITICVVFLMFRYQCKYLCFYYKIHLKFSSSLFTK